MTKWRLMEPEDLPAVKALHKKQQAQLGTSFPLPDFFAKPSIITLVHERKGAIDWVITGEAEVEISSIGNSPLPANEVSDVADQLAIHFRARGFRIVRSYVPSKLVFSGKGGKHSAMRRFMMKMKFSEEGDTLRGFYRCL